MDHRLAHVGIAIVDNRGVEGDHLAFDGGGGTDPNVGRLDGKVGRRGQGDLEDFLTGVVGLFGLGDKVAGIDNHFDLAFRGGRSGAGASRHRGDITHFGDATATGGDHGDDLLLTNRGGAVVGGINKLHRHLIGFAVAVIEHRSAQGDLITCCGIGQVKADVGLQHDQIRRGGGDQAQTLFGVVVTLFALCDQVIRIDHHADIAVAREAAGLIGDLQGGTAAGRDQINRLQGADRVGAGPSGVDKLDLHRGGIGTTAIGRYPLVGATGGTVPIIADGGKDGHLVTGVGRQGVKANVG